MDIDEVDIAGVLNLEFDQIPAPRDYEALVLQTVYEACKDYPSLLPKIIEKATKGVKVYAVSQRRTSSELSAILMTILCTGNPKIDKKKNPFTAEDILKAIEPWYKNAPIWEKITKKFLGGK